MHSSPLALNGQALTLEELAAIAYERLPVMLHQERDSAYLYLHFPNNSSRIELSYR